MIAGCGFRARTRRWEFSIEVGRKMEDWSIYSAAAVALTKISVVFSSLERLKPMLQEILMKMDILLPKLTSKVRQRGQGEKN